MTANEILNNARELADKLLNRHHLDDFLKSNLKYNEKDETVNAIEIIEWWAKEAQQRLVEIGPEKDRFTEELGIFTEKLNALLLWHWIKVTEKVTDIEQKAVAFYLLGQLTARHGPYDSTQIPYHLIKKTFAHWAARDAVTRRHKEKREGLEGALALADKKWAGGDPAWHNEMADYLLGLNEYKNLSRRILLRELVQVAQKYNRVRGLKGVNKEKN